MSLLWAESAATHDLCAALRLLDLADLVCQGWLTKVAKARSRHGFGAGGLCITLCYHAEMHGSCFSYYWHGFLRNTAIMYCRCHAVLVVFHRHRQIQIVGLVPDDDLR